ncbi:hypothetical protein EUGRSUZ_K03091 [Eucalyptus grandis]|uniref:Uncharacterized protein n=2 Tax=Eucalyptus grandis TaxID=71139 RepID=A0ACC3IZG5_EUCGR|nr:hypothetical protein EUGRSUZ_K03091 [Eucalyptus grandis]
MLVVIVLAISLLANAAVSPEIGDFTYSGFTSVNHLSLDGLAVLTGTGLMRLTNVTKQKVSHAFYPDPIGFKNSSSGAVHSFPTTFLFAIISEYPALGGHGFAFVIAPSREIPGAWPNFFWGLFNETNIGNATNHIFAVEFETVQNNELRNINDNHVGIYVNGLTSIKSSPAGYTENNVQGFRNLSLISGKAMQAWVDYDDVQKQISVTLAPVNVDKPSSPLLFLSYKLSPIFIETMYVGFWSSTGSLYTSQCSHYILGWSFRVNGQAQRKFAEVLEDWDCDYSLHRFKYKDLYVLILALSLYVSTKGFRDEELLGAGGFGRVYRGALPSIKTEIAVKRVSQIEARNEGVHYGDYYPDKYLYNQPKVTLNWSQRFRVIKGVAYGPSYLHEGWEQAVIHRDIKASNILLDLELNERLGDFGLAKRYDHSIDPQSTHVEKGDILETRDLNLGRNFVAKDVKLVLQLELLWSQSWPTARPSMRQVVQHLEGDLALEELSIGICFDKQLYVHK